MRLLPLLLSSALTGVALAQTPDLLVQGFPTAPESQPSPGSAPYYPWGSTTDQWDTYAAFASRGEPGWTTLLFAHTTLDTSATSASPPATLRGLLVLYPFLAEAVVSGSQLSASLGSGYVVQSTGDLKIPLARLKDHIQLANDSNLLEFGPQSTASWQLHDWQPTNEPDNTDARKPWAGTVTNGAFDVNAVGSEALRVAAYTAAGTQSNQAGIEAMRNLLHQDYGFVVHVQAVHMKKQPPNQPTLLKWSQVAKLKRISLKGAITDPWFAEYGPYRWCPSIFAQNHDVHIAGQGEWLHVQINPLVMPPEGYRLVALIPTMNGGLATPERVPNKDGIRPDIARFPYPHDGVSGFHYFGYQSLTDPYSFLPIVPMNSYAGGYAAMVLSVLPTPLPQ